MGGVDIPRWMDLALPLVCDDQPPDLIYEQMERVGRAVDRIYGPLPDHQKAALVSFGSDPHCGYFALARSTVCQLIQLGRHADAEHYWIEYCRADGKISDLAFLRRRMEVNLFMTGSYVD